jgi:hypothetical protein
MIMDEKPSEHSPDGDSPSSAERLLHQGQRLRQEFGGLFEAAEQSLDELEAFLREQLEHHPYGTLAAAIAGGYVLGGGIPSVVTKRMLELGGRIAIAALIQSFVAHERPDQAETAV